MILIYDQSNVKIYIENIYMENNTDMFTIIKLVTDKGETTCQINPYK